MGRKLVVLFDGTWNKGSDKTNVWQFKQNLADHSADGAAQLHCYIPGVGTRFYNRMLGGMFGMGLSDNLLQGYEWLCHNWRSGDAIYSFGFSRGAYTARSLAGIIRKCGLLNNPGKNHLKMAAELYRDKHAAPADVMASNFRQRYAHEQRVRMVGVWDTVGALGIPMSSVPFGRGHYQWHDTELSKIVDYAYHAIAIDEHRRDFDVAVWQNTLKPENIEVEQRWFVGAHSNVGGGYDVRDPLARITLDWMMRKAEGAGLAFRQAAGLIHNGHLAGVNDSFSAFMAGAYARFRERHHRSFGQGQNEVIDASAWARWQRLSAYRPTTLDNQTPET